MSLRLTSRDCEILDHLSTAVRLFSLDQIARTWWSDAADSRKLAEDRIRRLARAGWLERYSVLVRPMPEIVAPVACWRPGQRAADFGQIAWRVQSRWKKGPRKCLVVVATNRATKLRTGKPARKIKQYFQLTHDVGVAETFLRFRETRLIENAHLAKHEFLAKWVYFTLGLRGAKLFGVPARCALPLGTQSLYTQFGILGYCFGEKPQRTRLRVAKLLEKHPALLKKGVDPSQYVVDASTTPSLLSFVRVDGGGPNDHVLRKIDADIKCRLAIPLCASLMQSGRFQIACVTFTEEKQKELERKIPGQKFPCAVTVEVVPILRDLLAVLRAIP